jgi:hypothetical protein
MGNLSAMRTATRLGETKRKTRSISERSSNSTMFDMSTLGQLAPILLILGAGTLLYRTYLKLRGKLQTIASIPVSVAQLVAGTLCIIAAFFASPYYDTLTAGILILLAVANILIIITAGGRMPIAAILALGLGIIFGYMGAASVKYKVVIFFELFDKNVPEMYVGIALAVLIAAVAYVVLRMLQDLLVAVAGILDFPLVTVIIVVFSLAQVCLLLTGTSLQPFLQELINQV